MDARPPGTGLECVSCSVVGESLPVCVFSVGAATGGTRLASILGVPLILDAWALRLARPRLVLVCLPVADLGRAAWDCTRAGAAVVIAAPLGAPAPLPWWGRRFHRILLSSQEEARGWRAAGVALGRLVVVAPGDEADERRALQAVLAESLSMARRPW